MNGSEKNLHASRVHDREYADPCKYAVLPEKWAKEVFVNIMSHTLLQDHIFPCTVIYSVYIMAPSTASNVRPRVEQIIQYIYFVLFYKYSYPVLLSLLIYMYAL